MSAERPTLTIIRGLPGSGKSTLARELYVAGHATGAHFEADMFFTDRDGVYRYEHDRVQEAHAWCLEGVKGALERGYDTIVSNTFTRIWEFEPYLKLGFPTRVIGVQGPWKSVHGIPEASWLKMQARWEPYHPGVFVAGAQGNGGCVHPPLPGGSE